MGAQRWLNLGFVKIQPSELAKLFFPAFISYYLYTQNESFLFKKNSFIPILGILFLSILLILKQPDLGTALILLFSGLLCIWVAGLNNRWFLYGFLTIILCTPLLWCSLKPYQRNRIAVFLGQVDISDDTNLAANNGVTLTGDTLSIDSVSASNFTAAYDHSRGNVTDHADVSNAGSGQIITSDERDRFGRAWTNISSNSADYNKQFNSSEIAAASARYTQTALSVETNVVPNTALLKPMNIALSNSFAFAGHLASIVAKRWKK